MAAKQSSILGRGIFVFSCLLIMLGNCQAQNTTTFNEADCTSETTSLNTDPTIEAAVSDLQTQVSTAVQDDFFSFCSILDRACTVDIDNYSSELQTSCNEAGGQIARRSASLECRGKVVGVPIPGGVELKFANIPACVGTSCDPDNLPQVVVDAVDAVLQQVETVVEGGLEDGNCTAAASSSSSSGAASTTDFWMWTRMMACAAVVSSFLGSMLL